ncbi:MAG: HlyD family efflux transporter periplasmic adaptor subunit [Bacteroidota bacterium]
MKLKNLIIHICWIVVLTGFTSCGKSYEETQPIREDITITVFAPGTLEAEDSYELTARADGYIEEILFEENDLVTKGQLLAVIDNKQNQVNAQSSETLYRIAASNAAPDAPKLAQARNTVALAQQQMKQDSTIVVRYKVLKEAKAIAAMEYENKFLQYQDTKKEYENAVQQYELQKKQAEEQLVINRSQKEINQTLSSYNRLEAVQAGKVYSKLKEAGDFVHQGEAIARIGDAQELYARVNIDEQSISKVHMGQEALIKLNINETKEYRGKISEILPTFSESSQSFIAKITFTDSLDFDIINTQLQANIIIETAENVLLIPRRFLGYGSEVTLKGEDEPTKVHTKVVSSQWVQVVSGLDENDVIVTQK